MADFTKALNAIRSTVNRAGKMYSKLPSQVAMRTSRSLAYAPKIGIAGAAGGAIVGAGAAGKDHRVSGAAKGMAIGGMLGLSKWKGGMPPPPGSRTFGGGATPAIRGLLSR